MKPQTKITVFDCEDDEAGVFRTLSPRFGIEPVMTKQSVPASHAVPFPETRCISVGHKSRITASDLLTLRDAGVQFLSTRSIGYDHIDTEAAGRLGITIANAAYAPDGVADYTLMLILMLLRSAGFSLSRTAHFDFRLPPCRGKELRDMTVGIIGAGRIGRAVQKRLRGFGCRILLCDQNDSADCVPLCLLLKESDLITLHVPLSDVTYHMLGQEQFLQMKPGAFLINTARGALIDTPELIRALNAGRLGGAALDVLEDEEGFFYFDWSHKSVSHPFLSALSDMPNVIVTPHTAYYTDRILYDTVEKTLANCADFERSNHHE
ncbi:MAG: D-lactate dehydrogenase VanH-A [Clostridium sp.]|nr:D-lactate dehydrogenase VanH-A [Clostridium sp.]